MRLLATLLLVLWTSISSVNALGLLSSNQLVFVNVDHAPIGACGTITYGYKGATCGVGTFTGAYPYYVPYHDGVGGVLIGLSGNSGMQLLPFVTNVSTTASFFPDANVQRRLTPGTDEYGIMGAAAKLTFAHFTPAWSMPDLSAATTGEKRRYFLPATWMVFTVDNTNSTPADFYFGLPVPVTQKTFAGGAYEGFSLGEVAMAVQTGSCELLSGTALKSVFNSMTQGFAFHVRVPAGQTKSLTAVIAYYRSGVVDSHRGARYYYTSLYPDLDSVIDAAFAGLGTVKVRCQQLADAMHRAGLNPFRQFLACHALQSYRANTACLVDPQGNVHWWEIEGIFNYINTFDLTVDHAFYNAWVQPWALRNVLDAYSGALPGTGYSYETPLHNPAGTIVSPHGFSFHHDMGVWPTSGTSAAYGPSMGDEELQSWILSAGLYWSQIRDDAWLTNNLPVLQRCLNSMLLRDHTNAAARDGITKNINAGEITTWDSLDASLRNPAFNGRLAVRNWACYLALGAMFSQAGVTADAATCQSMAAVTAQTIVNRWNAYRSNLGHIPALLDGSSLAGTTPMIEGLAYPAVMGLTNAIDPSGGPYAAMLQALSNHTVAVLVPGKCLDAGTGAWLGTSANQITWQSKVFLAQYAAEAVLGITSNSVNGLVDQIHASVQIQGSQVQGYSDAFLGNGTIQGGSHYPRGITTALRWLNATNNPPNPIPTAVPEPPTISLARAGDGQVLLLWDGVPFAATYTVKRSTSTDGLYAPVESGVEGASYVDSTVSNGTTYYYIVTASNQFGESAPSAKASATPVPSAGCNIFATFGVPGVTVSWPSAYTGWILQTNTISLNNPAAWGDVPESLNHSQLTFPAGGRTTEYFRLRHP